MAVSKIEHIGIKVAQLEQSLTFYQEVIGLTLQDKIGEPDSGLRLAFLSFPGQTSVEVELIERVWTGLPDEGKVSHVAFTVTGIEAEHSRIASLKLAGLTEISTLANGSRYFFFDGPDGEKLEFFESTRSN